MIFKGLATLEPVVAVHDDSDVRPAFNYGHRDQSCKVGEKQRRPLGWSVRNHGKYHDMAAWQGSDSRALHFTLRSG